jgi:putative oxidoreductase
VWPNRAGAGDFIQSSKPAHVHQQQEEAAPVKGFSTPSTQPRNRASPVDLPAFALKLSIKKGGWSMETNSLTERWAPRLLSILRIVAALIFLEHGTQKLLGFPAAPSSGYPASMSLLWWQGIIELLGGGVLLLGLFTRPVAFILAGNMAFAYWMAHAPKSTYPVLNGGDAAILYCFVFLYIACAGAGAWSLDKRLR